MDPRLFSYGMTPSSDIMKMQQQANAASQKAYEKSSINSLTVDTAFGDAHEALVGLAEDLSGRSERHSLKDMLLHGDRMRGLGVLLIAAALVGLFVDYVMH